MAEEEWHDLEHALEDLLAEAGEVALTGGRFHLQLALDSLRVGTADDAARHLEHAPEASDDEAEQSRIQEALTHL